jgi:hypothetical protein
MEIPKKIKDSIWDYCKLNDISNIDDFIIKMINQGFSIEKYGSTPFSDVLEKEIVEKVVEVPIEVKVIEYKDKEVIKEVPIEVIKYVDREVIKEVIVEKEVPIEKVVTKVEYISDKSGEDKLGETIVNLEKNISQLNTELENEKEKGEDYIEQISKKDKELDELRRNLDEVKEKLDDKSKDEKIESLNKQVDNLEKEMSKKGKELDELRRSIDVKKEKTKVENKPDIYNEDKKGGWWGSNTMK